MNGVLGLFWTSLDFHVTATSYPWQIPLVLGLSWGGNLFSFWVLYTYLKLTVTSLAFSSLKKGSGEPAFALAYSYYLEISRHDSNPRSISFQIPIADSQGVLQIKAYCQVRDD